MDEETKVTPRSDDWPCTCGHKKAAIGESHFFGDPRPGESMAPWCMVKDCKCTKYTARGALR